MRTATWMRVIGGMGLAIPLITAGVAIAQPRFYNPIPIQPGQTLRDQLTRNDIPTGQGGFARDYQIQLQAGSQVTIDVSSASFDAIVYLIGADGAAIAENDDGPDGTSNALLFARIMTTGTYTIRVRSFGEAMGGNFTLKVTLLRPQ